MNGRRRSAVMSPANSGKGGGGGGGGGIEVLIIEPL